MNTQDRQIEKKLAESMRQKPKKPKRKKPITALTKKKRLY